MMLTFKVVDADRIRVAMAMCAAVVCWSVAPAWSAPTAKDFVRDALLQQSEAQRAGCTGVQRALEAGSDATLVVRTAVEMGFNSCHVIHCALEGKTESQTVIFCEKVIRGAVLSGVQPDVISRCADEYCNPTAVAALLRDAFLEPNYCYFAFQPLVAPELLPPPAPGIERSFPIPPPGPPSLPPVIEPPVIEIKEPPPPISPYGF